MAMTAKQIRNLTDEERQAYLAKVVGDARRVRAKAAGVAGRVSPLTQMLAAEPQDGDTDQEDIPASMRLELAGAAG